MHDSKQLPGWPACLPYVSCLRQAKHSSSKQDCSDVLVVSTPRTRLAQTAESWLSGVVKSNKELANPPLIPRSPLTDLRLLASD